MLLKMSDYFDNSLVAMSQARTILETTRSYKVIGVDLLVSSGLD